MLRTSLLTSSLLLLAGAASGQSVVVIGGAGSYSSEGTYDPGLLGDDLTVASARLVFTLDKPNSRLTLDVQNTSPVITGVPNPVLSRLYFNTPSDITGMSLAAQSAAEGTPTFELTFDASLANPNPNGAGFLGAFNVQLDNLAGVGGSIANPDADTFAAPYVVVGPARFEFVLVGDLTGVEDTDFVSLLSTTPPGSQNSIAAGHFQAGGERGASAFLGDGDQFCDLTARVDDLGGGCGATLSSTLPEHTVPWTMTVQGTLPGARGVLLASMPTPSSVIFQGCEVVLHLPTKFRMGLFITDANGVATSTTTLPPDPACCGLEVSVQAFMVQNGGLSEATNGLRLRFGS
jgi:hypothetical protein